MSDRWIRVSKKNPCKVCGHPDWCSEGTTYLCCMRVVSPKLSANGGYLHLKGEGRVVARREPKPEEPITINAASIMWSWLERTDPMDVDDLAKELGVTPLSLRTLDIAWAEPYSAWAFPMRDGEGNIIGIRLRAQNGDKFAVKGSHQGIFTPCCASMDTAYICEGPSDTAAALSIGIYAIGRASCVGGIDHIKKTLKRKHVRRAVVISDNDGPGLRGSETLMLSLDQPACRLVLPEKDMRAFVKSGGNCAILDSILRNMKWTKPTAWLHERTTGSEPMRLGITIQKP